MTVLHHVGYYVDDLEEAVAQAVRDLGIGPFLVHEHVTFDEFRCAPGVAEREPVAFDHTAAFAAWGPVVLELGQVHDIDPGLAAAYGVAPGAMSHVSWVVDDLEAETARLTALGCSPINTARSGPIHVSWHTGGRLFPHPVRRPPFWVAPQPDQRRGEPPPRNITAPRGDAAGPPSGGDARRWRKARGVRD